MAQDNWINITVDPSAANKSEQYHGHISSGGSGAALDATFSYDHLKVNSLAVYDSVQKAIRLALQARGLK